MNITILKDINNIDFSLKEKKIYALLYSKEYLVVPENEIHELFMNYQLGNNVQGEEYYLILPDNNFLELKNTLSEETAKTPVAIKRSDSEKRIISVLEEAIIKKASDVHFVREDDIARIKMRINGKVELFQELQCNSCDEMLFVLYNVMASTKETTWNTKNPQDANILIDINKVSYRFRYAHMPIFGTSSLSYHAVIRVIYPNLDKSVCTDLATLGLFKVEEELMDNILSNPSGLVIVSGVTGSGKSTSLKNYMEYLYFTKHHEKGTVLTVEDPVEYVIEGAQQSSVTKSKGDENLFAVAVRSAMRRDPDILMIGEIRDQDTGKALASAVESGHLCLATVHAGNCVGVLQRLSGLGVGLDKLSTPGFIVGITNQKLAPLVCPECSTETVNDYDRPVRVQGAGCERCKGHGIIGRKLVLEQLVPDFEVLKLVSEQRWVDIYAYNKTRRAKDKLSEGFSIKDKIYYLCLSGLVCSDYFKSSYGPMELEDENLIFQVHQSNT